MKRVQRRTVLILVVVAALCPSVASASVVYRGVADLTAGAKQILVGDVTAVISFWDAEHRLIKSRVVVNVDQYLVGDGTCTEVLVMSGGTVDDLTLNVSVLPEFEVGDHVLLFLADGESRLVQSFQGAYLTDGVEIARMNPVCGRIIGESIRPLTDFVAEIQQALPPGTVLPEIEPYTGDFVLPTDGLRYSLCGDDWTYMPLPMGEDYLINPNCVDAAAGDPATQVAQMLKGMETWDNAGADFLFSYGGPSTLTDVDQDGTNLMYFDTTPPDDPTPPADYIASNYRWSTGSDIVESDIVFNDRDFTWWDGEGSCGNKTDIWNEATHELGHTLCLEDLYAPEDDMKTMYGYGEYCDLFKRTLHPDDAQGIRAIYGERDTTPPEPNPMTFQTPPYKISESQIRMVASLATDSESPPVYYAFDCSTGGAGCDDSDYAGVRTYNDYGLSPNTEYCYRVRARDSAARAPNETGYSAVACAYTYAAIPGAPTLDNETASSMDITIDPNGNPSYTEFAIYCSSSPDPSWEWHSVDASGNPSASLVWQSLDDWGTVTAVGMQPDTQYCFQVGAKNEDGVQTEGGPEACSVTGTETLINMETAAGWVDHGGTERPIDMSLVGGAVVEPRLAGIGKIVVDVDVALDPATVIAGNVSVVGVTNPGPYTPDTVTLGGANDEVTIEFNSALPDIDCYTFDLTGMESFDGGGFDPATGSEFQIVALVGDVNRDAQVSSPDGSSVKARLGVPVTDANCQYDVNNDGQISSTDKSSVKARLQTIAPCFP